MYSLKDKMYNYEVTPPPESWQIIATALDKSNINIQSVKPVKKYNKAFYFSLAAASVTIIFFSVFIWINNSNRVNKNIITETTKLNNGVGSGIKNADHNAANQIITVPKTNDNDDLSASKTGQAEQGDKFNDAKAELSTKKYITISGPQGQPVKISSKVAALLVSSNDQHASNPVWNEKVKRWKNIMKANALAPTTANFLDIVDLTHALTINNP